MSKADEKLIETVWDALKAESKRKRKGSRSNWLKRHRRGGHGKGSGNAKTRKNWAKRHKRGGHGAGPPSYEKVAREPLQAEARKKGGRKRERINPSGKKGRSRFILRRPDGTIRTNVAAGRSVTQDKRSKAKRKVKKGLGHLGDTVRKGARKVTRKAKRFLGMEKKR